jgi:hypothetical protein
MHTSTATHMRPHAWSMQIAHEGPPFCGFEAEHICRVVTKQAFWVAWSGEPDRKATLLMVDYGTTWVLAREPLRPVFKPIEVGLAPYSN